MNQENGVTFGIRGRIRGPDKQDKGPGSRSSGDRLLNSAVRPKGKREEGKEGKGARLEWH